MDADILADDREALLSECLIFRALDEDGRRTLAARASEVRCDAGETIFHIGDPGRSMMVVAEGSVRVSLPGTNGREIILADLERGAVLGELSLLDGRPRSATATALAPCKLLKLERPAIGPLLKSSAATCLAIVDLLCERLRESDTRMIDIEVDRKPVSLAAETIDAARVE